MSDMGKTTHDYLGRPEYIIGHKKCWCFLESKIYDMSEEIASNPDSKAFVSLSFVTGVECPNGYNHFVGHYDGDADGFYIKRDVCDDSSEMTRDEEDVLFVNKSDPYYWYLNSLPWYGHAFSEQPYNPMIRIERTIE